MSKRRSSRKSQPQTPVPAAAARTPAGASPRLPEHLGGLAAAGTRLRLTQDDPMGVVTRLSAWFPRDWESDLRAGGFDPADFREMDGQQLRDFLLEISPEISSAHWTFLRLENPGYEYQVFPNTETGRVAEQRLRARWRRTGPAHVRAPADDQEEEDTAGKAVLDQFFETLKDRDGSANVSLNQALSNVFRNGDILLEVVFDRTGRVPLRLCAPDSRTVEFERENHPVLGQIHRPFQRQGDQKVYLDDKPTVRFVPLDARPGTRKGRAIMTASLFSTLFRLGLLHDLRRVIAQQGWPRIDISVIGEAINLHLDRDPELAANPKKKQAAYDEAFAQIRKAYGDLEPDDAYVHPDWVEVKTPVGTVDAHSLGAVDTVVDVLDHQDVRALKTMPILFGMTESTTETQANRQWEIAAAGHKAVQHLLEETLESLLTVVLNAAGRQGRVVFRFAELRAAEAQRDSQTESLVIANAREKYEAGWITQDQAAQEGAGVEEAAEEEPRGGMGAPPPPELMENPEPGSARNTQESRETRGDRVTESGVRLKNQRMSQPEARNRDTMGVDPRAEQCDLLEPAVRRLEAAAARVKGQQQPEPNTGLGEMTGDVRCRVCGRWGWALDEFTSPYTGRCADCEKQQQPEPQSGNGTGGGGRAQAAAALKAMDEIGSSELAALLLDAHYAESGRSFLAVHPEAADLWERAEELVKRATEPVTPAGADVALPPLPVEVTVSAEDKRNAAEAFDESLPEVVGLLEAEAVE